MSDSTSILRRFCPPSLQHRPLSDDFTRRSTQFSSRLSQSGPTAAASRSGSRESRSAKADFRFVSRLREFESPRWRKYSCVSGARLRRHLTDQRADFRRVEPVGLEPAELEPPGLESPEPNIRGTRGSEDQLEAAWSRITLTDVSGAPAADLQLPNSRSAAVWRLAAVWELAAAWGLAARESAAVWMRVPP